MREGGEGRRDRVGMGSGRGGERAEGKGRDAVRG